MAIISDVLLFAHNCFLPIPCSFCLRYFYNGFVVKLARWWPCRAFIWEALPLAADLSYIFACWVCTSVRQTVVWAYTSVCQPTFSLLLLLGRSLLSWICFGVCLFVCFKAESHCVALTSLGILPPSECSDCRHMPPRPVLYFLFLSPSFHVCLPQCLVYNQPTLSSCVDFFFLHKQLPQILDFTTEIFY